MSSAYIEWCNENEGRAYPLAENATAVDNSQQVLPTDLLVDLHIMVPADRADIWVSSVWVTPTLIGVSIAHADGPVASAVVARSTYTPYTAVPLQVVLGVENVSGWVAFGNYAVVVRKRWLFDTVAQAGLAQRAVKVVDALPVRSMRKLGGYAATFAERLVTILGSGYLKIYPHESNDQQVVIELTPPEARALFLGPCFSSAELGDCGTPPLRQINNVCPDEDGILTLVFE